MKENSFASPIPCLCQDARPPSPIVNPSFLILLILAFPLIASSASPALRITYPATNTIQIDWTSIPGATYQLLMTSNADAFAFWRPLGGAIVAGSTNSTIQFPRTNDNAFYKLHELGQPGSGQPSVSIISHTNGEMVTGLTRIAVAAGDDSRLGFVSLYIDGKKYEGSITEGDLYWHVNTGTFSNGTHTVQALVVDNSGDASLGGSADSVAGGNTNLSMPVNLVFTNIVRWIDPVAGFTTHVPIFIHSDLFPTNWTVYVQNENRTVVRTFGGYTTTGIIETNWDGRDNNGILVPSKHGYQVLFTLGELPPPPIPPTNAPPPPPPMLGGSAMATTTANGRIVRAGRVNRYGTLDYEIATPLPPIPRIYFDEVTQLKIARGELPPLPPVRPGMYSPDPNQPSYRTRRVSMLEAAAAGIGEASGPTNNPVFLNPPVTNSTIVWFEDNWERQQALLARQKFYGGVTIQTLNAAFAVDLTSLQTLITDARDGGDPRLALSGVCCGGISVVDNSADFDVLLNDLLSDDMTDFYYIGHSSGNGIGYSEGSKTNGITTKRLMAATGNSSTRNSPAWNGRWLFKVNTPYRFVFIDGCLSATGPFHEAFGIIHDVNAVSLGRKRRAYLGWNDKAKNSLLNTTHERWSARFWQYWIDTTRENYDVKLDLAILRASADYSIPNQPQIIGFVQLTWAWDGY